MNTRLFRILKAACVTAVAAVLTACGGATSTVDPFHPSRVIGLGDTYNVTDGTIYSVRTTSTVESVVGYVAALFGYTGTIDSHAVNNGTISNLASQIAAVNTFNASDLVVVSAGSAEIKAAYSTSDPTAAAEAAADDLVVQIKDLLARGARHILVMPPLELSVTPYAVDNRTRGLSPAIPLNYDTSPTVKFNTRVVGSLQSYVSRQGYSNNPIIVGGLSLASMFNSYATGTLTGYFANGTTPWCTNGGTANDPTNIQGCSSDPTNGDGNYLFADGIHLTPAGNRWVASYLYNATAQGWR